MKKYAASYILFSILLASASCSSKTESKAEEKTESQKTLEGKYELSEKQFQSSEMSIGGLQKKSFNEIIKATGMFDVPPENRASVSSYFDGTVKEIKLLPGERVKKGQILFTLENPDFVQIQQNYLEIQGQLAYLKSDYERQKNLVQDNVSSQKNFLKAESDYTVAKVTLESLGKKLTLMNIPPNLLTIKNIRTTVNVTSPINGFVTQVDISQGAFLNSSQSAITIVNTDHLHLELNIFEKDITKVRVGQPIQFRIQEDKGNEYEATVHLVNKTVDPTSRKILIHAHPSSEKAASKFSPGMYVEADINSTAISKASLPEDAIVEVEGKFYALVLQDSTKNGYSFIKREIKTGDTNNGFVEILNQNSFNEQTQFLTKGAFNLIKE
ncbi:MAG: efflux RND transporter periplasmic adaptor subunit [Bacteroidetes bacterium]|nr:efflux RND transporter periplasmic adaptor subunit [Bacteroidota bacterium]